MTDLRVLSPDCTARANADTLYVDTGLQTWGIGTDSFVAFSNRTPVGWIVVTETGEDVLRVELDGLTRRDQSIPPPDLGELPSLTPRRFVDSTGQIVSGSSYDQMWVHRQGAAVNWVQTVAQEHWQLNRTDERLDVTYARFWGTDIAGAEESPQRRWTNDRFLRVTAYSADGSIATTINTMDVGQPLYYGLMGVLDQVEDRELGAYYPEPHTLSDDGTWLLAGNDANNLWLVHLPSEDAQRIEVPGTGPLQHAMFSGDGERIVLFTDTLWIVPRPARVP